MLGVCVLSLVLMVGLCGRKATLNLNCLQQSSVAVWQSRWPSCPNSKHRFTTSFLRGKCRKAMLGVCVLSLVLMVGLCGRKATLNLNCLQQSSVAVWQSRWPSCPNSKHRFTTSFLRGRCRKAMLGVCVLSLVLMVGLCGRKATLNLNCELCCRQFKFRVALRPQRPTIRTKDRTHTPSIAFRHLPLRKECRKPVLGVLDRTVTPRLSHSYWALLQTVQVQCCLMMMNWCLMSSDVMRHIRDKLWPMPKHGAINLYVHGNQKAR